MTAKNNVLIGRVDRPAHDELWMGAVEAAGLSRLLAELPEGGDTVLSRKFDNGHDLSGGQWQRFAVARAIYRDAAVLLADEPTSALDPKAEANVLARLCRDDAGRDSLGRITVIVTHRLVNVRLADRIVVLRDGVVVETGTHDELMTRCGHYWEMYRAQSLVYSSSDEKGVLPVRAQSR